MPQFPVTLSVGLEPRSVYRVLPGQVLVPGFREAAEEPSFDVASDPGTEAIKLSANRDLESITGLRWVSVDPDAPLSYGREPDSRDQLLPIYQLDGAGFSSLAAPLFDKLIIQIDPLRRPAVVNRLQALGLTRNDEKSRELANFDYFEVIATSSLPRTEVGLRAMEETRRILGVISADFEWLNLPIVPPVSFSRGDSRASTCDRWSLERIGLLGLDGKPIATGKKRVVVAVVDTPVHGPSVAGIVRAVAPGCEVLPIYMNSLHGSSVKNYIDYAVAEKASVINLSITVNGASYAQQAILNAAKTAVICASAGNYSENESMDVTFPANHPSVIAVGACDREDRRVKWTEEYRWGSRFGPSLGVVAPGVSVLGVDSAGSEYCFNMTSAACPVVAGVIALIRSEFPTLSPLQVKSVLESTCKRVHPNEYPYKGHPNRPGWERCNEMGYGRIDVAAAFKVAKERSEGRFS